MVEQIDITINGGDVDKFKPDTNYTVFGGERRRNQRVSYFMTGFDSAQPSQNEASAESKKGCFKL